MYTYLPVMIFSSLVGTYADLIMVKQQFYTFPVRPFPHLFEINVAFTLLLLPIGTGLFIFLMERVGNALRTLLMLVLGLLMPLVEQFAEDMGWFVHTPEWSHSYSFIGYIFFLYLIWKSHLFISRQNQFN